MKKTTHLFTRTTVWGLAVCLACALSAHATQLINFPFNEGTGTTVTDVASGLTGAFGAQDPAVDFVELTDFSPSVESGRAITTHGAGFLLVDDSDNPILNITAAPITIESWVYIPVGPLVPAEGIVAYGGSYKMGLKSGLQVFTLFGFVDITNTVASFIPVDQWVHLAAAWNPGEGVHFYVNGIEYFEANNTPAARDPLHNYLSIASEGFGNNLRGSFDRVRIHAALLGTDDLDNDAANPKAPLASTLVAYNFNETDFPVDNAIAPSRPSIPSYDLLGEPIGPVWSDDTPTGLPGDHALAFLRDDTQFREVMTVYYGATPINLGENNTSYTLQAWIKLPPGLFDERMVIYRTDGLAPRISLSINFDRTLHTTLLGTQDFFSGVAVPDDDRWHHVAAVMQDFEQVHFYLDGVLRQIVTRTRTGEPNSDPERIPPGLRIGKESEPRYFRGVLDRVIINNTALAASELDYPAVAGLATFDTQPAGILVDVEATATFTATVTSPSPATYQWYRRANLTDPEGVIVPDATSTTLTLNNVAASDEGVYSLVVSNAAGESESHRAWLTVRPATTPVTLIGFESPTYASGFIGGQDSWTGPNNEGARVLTDLEIATRLEAVGITPGTTVQSGSQALFASAHNVAGATLLRPITGLETEQKVIMDVWVRGLLPGNTTAPIGNFFFAIEGGEGSAGTSRRAAFLGLRDTQTAVAIEPYISYGIPVGNSWARAEFMFDGDSWYQLTAIFDYSARTYDFFVNGMEAGKKVPFVHSETAESFRQLRVFRGANQAGVIIDDLRLGIPTTPANPQLGVRKEGDSIVIFWPASFDDYGLEATDSLSAISWSSVSHTTVGDENQATVEPTGTTRFYRLIK